MSARSQASASLRHRRCRQRWRTGFVLFLLVIAGPAVGADCIYLANCHDNLVVLDESDLSLLYSMYDSMPYLPAGPVGLVVNGGFAYTNQEGDYDYDSSGEYLFLPGTIIEFDVARQTRTAEFTTGRGNHGLVYANGKLYTPNLEEDTVTIVDPARRVTKTLEGFGEWPWGIAATPDGSRVFVGAGGEGATIFVVDTQTDGVILSFPTCGGITTMLATDDQLFVSCLSLGLDLAVYGREGARYVLQWTADLGFALQLATAGQQLFRVSRDPYLRSASLQPPHAITVYDVGTEADLVDVKEHDGLLYIAGQEGLFRFSPATGDAQLIYRCSELPILRHVAVAPCPPPVTGTVAPTPTRIPTPTRTPTVACTVDGAGSGSGCRTGEYCDFPFGTCGAGGVTGICSRPACICGIDIPPAVCGCDGQTYDLCEAWCVGVSIAYDGPCATPFATPTPPSKPSPTASPSRTATLPPTASATSTPSASPTPSGSPTPSSTPYPTASPTATPPPTASATSTSSVTPTPSASPSPSSTPTAFPSHTPSPTRVVADPGGGGGGGCRMAGTQTTPSSAAWLAGALLWFAWRLRHASWARKNIALSCPTGSNHFSSRSSPRYAPLQATGESLDPIGGETGQPQPFKDRLPSSAQPASAQPATTQNVNQPAAARSGSLQALGVDRLPVRELDQVAVRVTHDADVAHDLAGVRRRQFEDRFLLGACGDLVHRRARRNVVAEVRHVRRHPRLSRRRRYGHDDELRIALGFA
jgi:hypothetical protein